LKKGWFPQDIDMPGSVDFVLLDCPKDAGDFKSMSEALVPFLQKDRFAVFVHDTHGYVPEFKSLSKNIYEVEAQLISNFDFGEVKAEQFFPIGLITNIEN
jgi:hypothetical protein